MKKFLFLILAIFFVSLTCYAEDSLKLPESIVIIDQQMHLNTTFPAVIVLEITAVDVSTNEVLILIYTISEKKKKQELSSITNTGIKIDLEKQAAITKIVK